MQGDRCDNLLLLLPSIYVRCVYLVSTRECKASVHPACRSSHCPCFSASMDVLCACDCGHRTATNATCTGSQGMEDETLLGGGTCTQKELTPKLRCIKTVKAHVRRPPRPLPVYLQPRNPRALWKSRQGVARGFFVGGDAMLICGSVRTQSRKGISGQSPSLCSNARPPQPPFRSPHPRSV